MRKRTIALVIMLVMVVTSAIAFPSTEAYAASYPSCFMCDDSTFENVCIERSIACNEDSTLYFKWYRKYNYEKYEIDIYNSDGTLVASSTGTPPVSSIGHITLSWDTSDYSMGNYTIKVHKMFYSFYNWHEAPSVSTYYVTLQDHDFSNWKITKAATALAKGTEVRTCSHCKTQQKADIAKLKATIKLSATKKTIKKNKSFVLKIYNLAKGDSVKSVTSSKSRYVKVKKIGTNKYKIVGKKKGKSIIAVKLKSGKTAKCKVTVK